MSFYPEFILLACDPQLSHPLAIHAGGLMNGQMKQSSFCLPKFCLPKFCLSKKKEAFASSIYTQLKV
jgi:hypothetical protein